MRLGERAGAGIGAVHGQLFLALRAQPLAHARGLRLHRLEGIGHDRQRLVLDLDQRRRVLGDRLGLGDDGDHRVTVEDDAVERQRRSVAIGGVRRRQRQILAGEDADHARHGPSSARLDAHEARVGVGTDDEACVHHARQLHVAGEAGDAGDLAGAIDARHGATDGGVLVHG